MANTSYLALRQGMRRVIPKPVRATYFQLVKAYHRHQLMHGRQHEQQVCRALKLLIQPGWTCIDVGANCGIMTVFMAKSVGPLGKVFAFEPHPVNITRIENNTRLCRVEKRVQWQQTAVGDGSCSRLSLYAGRRHSHAEWNTVGADADGNATEAVMTVPVVSLDNAIPSDKRIDLVKIDVEGAESQVLAGMTELLKQWAPLLVIECHNQENWKACTALCDQGYQLFDIHKRPLDPFGPLTCPHIIAIHNPKPQPTADN